MLSAILSTLVLASAPSIPPEPSLQNPWPRAGTIKVRLIDVFEARPVSNAEVRVFSDNGVRCCCAPCPTEGAEWRGRSDSLGYVSIPATSLNHMTSVSTALHVGARLTMDSPRDADGARIVELLPTALDAGGPLDLGLTPIKLVDRTTGKPIANLEVRIDFGDTESLELTTNALGFLFIPAEKKLLALDTSTVTVPGYRRRTLDFGGVNVETPLERSRR